MNNLFIMHTQYNLILGIGIASQFAEGTNNELILYAEFSVSQEMKQTLEKIFSRVLYIREQYEEPGHGLTNEKELFQQVKMVKTFLSPQYDNVFISEDRPLEQIILKKMKRRNPDCHFSSVEDGKQVYISCEKEQLQLETKNNARRFVRKVLRLLLYREVLNDEDFAVYGMNPLTSCLYVLIPEAVDKDFRTKEIKECTAEMLTTGINRLYGSSQNEKANKKAGLIIVSDLLERYRNKEVIISLFSEIALFCKEARIDLYIKYHPRETNKLQTECEIKELSTGIAVEKIYLEFDESKTMVLGNTSTSILAAKKLGFKATSIIKMSDSNQNIINAFENIGIEMPTDNDEMIKLITEFFGVKDI